MDVESRLRGAELPDVSVDTEAALSGPPTGGGPPGGAGSG